MQPRAVPAGLSLVAAGTVQSISTGYLRIASDNKVTMIIQYIVPQRAAVLHIMILYLIWITMDNSKDVEAFSTTLAQGLR